MISKREISAKIASNEFSICQIESQIEELEKKKKQYEEINTELETTLNDCEQFDDMDAKHDMDAED